MLLQAWFSPARPCWMNLEWHWTRGFPFPLALKRQSMLDIWLDDWASMFLLLYFPQQLRGRLNRCEVPSSWGILERPGVTRASSRSFELQRQCANLKVPKGSDFSFKSPARWKHSITSSTSRNYMPFQESSSSLTDLTETHGLKN